ncbi:MULTISPECIES: dihydrofolate reductase [Haloferacaceae]|uniref:dihydrofolate reductase n=1 Tax=Halorubrum glutamatedens TaxID=2707018 RepID=A0ABD5QP83_9EURY|nr:dihydrofolate reductase [Halobellus captivus]
MTGTRPPVEDADAAGAADAADAADASERDVDPEDVAFVLVAAVAENGVIGSDDGMPWHYPADLAHFKRLTTGHPVVLGRVTYQSIVERLEGPLPDRPNVVLTTREPSDLPAAGRGDGNVVVANGVEEAAARARTVAVDLGVEEVYVIGGATVYEAFLPLANRMVLTEIPGSPDGDTYFPEWDRDEFEEVDRETEGDLAFVTYERAEA